MLKKLDAHYKTDVLVSEVSAVSLVKLIRNLFCNNHWQGNGMSHEMTWREGDTSKKYTLGGTILISLDELVV